jgi:hypothetical protein
MKLYCPQCGNDKHFIGSAYVEGPVPMHISASGRILSYAKCTSSGIHSQPDLSACAVRLVGEFWVCGVCEGTDVYDRALETAVEVPVHAEARV